MFYKKLLKILAVFFCAAGIYWALKDQNFQLLQALNWQNILFCSGMIVFGYFFSGLQYYLVLHKMGCPMVKSDTLFFPFMQSFWGVVIPFQGTVMFAMFYLKKRYQFQVKESITMILFLYMFSVLFASFAGIWYSVRYLGCNTLFFWLSLFALLSPLYCFAAHKIMQKYGKIPFLPAKVNNFVATFFSGIHDLLTDWKNILLLLGCQLMRQICYAFIFVQLARSLGNPVPWLWGYLVTVSQELSIILRFTPGNMGLAEMVSGFVSSLTGIPAAVGINVSLFNTLLQILIILLIGGGGSYFILGKNFRIAKEIKENQE